MAEDIHRLEASSDEVGGLVIRKKAVEDHLFKKPEPPKASILGLDVLAAKRKKLKEEEEEANTKERRYRDRLNETPTHTGGVSDSFVPRRKEHHRGIEVRKDDRERKRHSDRRDRSERRHRSRSGDSSRRSHKYDGGSSRSFSRHERSRDDPRKSSRSNWSQRSDRSSYSSRSDRSYRKDIRTPRSIRAYDTPSNSHWEEDGDNLRKEGNAASAQVADDHLKSKKHNK